MIYCMLINYHWFCGRTKSSIVILDSGGGGNHHDCFNCLRLQAAQETPVLGSSFIMLRLEAVARFNSEGMDGTSFLSTLAKLATVVSSPPLELRAMARGILSTTTEWSLHAWRRCSGRGLSFSSWIIGGLVVEATNSSMRATGYGFSYSSFGFFSPICFCSSQGFHKRIRNLRASQGSSTRDNIVIEQDPDSLTFLLAPGLSKANALQLPRVHVHRGKQQWANTTTFILITQSTNLRAPTQSGWCYDGQVGFIQQSLRQKDAPALLLNQASSLGKGKACPTAPDVSVEPDRRKYTKKQAGSVHVAGIETVMREWRLFEPQYMPPGANQPDTAGSARTNMGPPPPHPVGRSVAPLPRPQLPKQFATALATYPAFLGVCCGIMGRRRDSQDPNLNGVALFPQVPAAVPAEGIWAFGEGPRIEEGAVVTQMMALWGDLF
ncbi:hypothetical protein K440DRAFT_646028 [Wilcoxina mikolae CBS 423.85]|nr:hypothetical protein K440DRAFT_646028 [Wilcoxina mikolae CBS 423.85]